MSEYRHFDYWGWGGGGSDMYLLRILKWINVLHLTFNHHDQLVSQYYESGLYNKKNLLKSEYGHNHFFVLSAMSFESM